MVTGSGPQAAKLALALAPCAVRTGARRAIGPQGRLGQHGAGHLKTALAGTYRHVSAKHAQRCLASFAWRFNRRYQLDSLTERLAYACARTAPHPYRVIIAG